jgi:hypothetical protein
VVKWHILVLVAALAVAWARSLDSVNAQTPDLIIDPPSGGAGSRFQIVGQSGWTAGEAVDVRVGFTPGDAAAFAGPFAIDEQVTVLADSTWSFPVVLGDSFFGGPAPANTGTVVVQARSASHAATATFAYTGLGQPPAAVSAAGFGRGADGASAAAVVAMFAAGVGAMLVAGGLGRRTGTRR